MALNNPAVPAVGAVLRTAERARTSNFSLLDADDYAFLEREIPADFPYLTLEDLNVTIKLGVKGKLDKYKSAPLNATRIYQWVEKNAPYSLGYWRTKFPELFRWAEMTQTPMLLLVGLIKIGETHGFEAVSFSSAKHELRTVIGTLAYPNLASGTNMPDGEARDLELHNRNYVETVLWPTFRTEYPEFAAKNPNLF